MLSSLCHPYERVARTCASFCIILAGLLLLLSGARGRQKPPTVGPAERSIKAFQAGEFLSYDISWSGMMRAGSAVMEVRSEALPDGREALRFSVTYHTAGIVDRLYRMGDAIQSVFDPETMQSLSFSLRQKHGKKTRRRDIVFDHERKQATIRLNDDPPETVVIPPEVQDPLTSLYYLRTREDFSPARPIIFKAFNNDKVWDIEFQTLGRERVKTPAGAFETIKVRASRGLFTGEGEVLLWLTDDVRKIPVLIKSKVPVGSLVFTLTSMKPGVDS